MAGYRWRGMSYATTLPHAPTRQRSSQTKFPTNTPAHGPCPSPRFGARVVGFCRGLWSLHQLRPQLRPPAGGDQPGPPSGPLDVDREAPGATEDGVGEPFVGRSGQLLDQLLADAGLDPSRDVYLCNVVKCRPPDNRKPRAGNWLPAVLGWTSKLPGSIPLDWLARSYRLGGGVGVKSGMSQLRGQWLAGEGRCSAAAC